MAFPAPKPNQLSKKCIQGNEWKHTSKSDFVIACSKFITWSFKSPNELSQYTAALCILQCF